MQEAIRFLHKNSKFLRKTAFSAETPERRASIPEVTNCGKTTTNHKKFNGTALAIMDVSGYSIGVFYLKY